MPLPIEKYEVDQVVLMKYPGRSMRDNISLVGTLDDGNRAVLVNIFRNLTKACCNQQVACDASPLSILLQRLVREW
jgi:hypothetical protein